MLWMRSYRVGPLERRQWFWRHFDGRWLHWALLPLIGLRLLSSASAVTELAVPDTKPGATFLPQERLPNVAGCAVLRLLLDPTAGAVARPASPVRWHYAASLPEAVMMAVACRLRRAYVSAIPPVSSFGQGSTEWGRHRRSVRRRGAAPAGACPDCCACRVPERLAGSRRG